MIKGKKLRAMLPPFLADLDIEDVKALCLEQLMGMSKQRIRCKFFFFNWKIFHELGQARSGRKGDGGQ